jgi:fatty acid desaturase
MMPRALLNAAVLIAATLTCWSCLWGASHLTWPYALPAMALFALVNNTLFALMHEAVHGIAATTRWANRLIGVICGWAFPTSFSMQRVAHIGHHERNRTDLELYDYYLPNQSRLLRNVWLYAGNLFGLYYWCVIFSNLMYLVAPWAYRSRYFVRNVAPALGFGPYVKDLAALPIAQVWAEIALAFGYQAALIYFLDLDALGYLACHALFALHWSVLQYADHAWSARDTRNGAWNLKVLPPSRWLALNYHCHLAHHQHPQVPWYELPKWVDPKARQPSFWRVYFSLWKGVRPAPPMGAAADLDFLFQSSESSFET